jgi:6-phosphogluconolactonase (cycloisomerase 2 family)
MRGRWLFVLAALLLPVGSAQAASVFVTNVNFFPGSVYPLAMAPDGAISLRSPASYQTAGNSPYDVAVLTSGRDIYVSLNDTPGSINQFAAGASGALTALSPPTVPTSTPHPSSVIVSPNGSSVYAAEQGTSADQIGQWTVRPNGTLTPKSPGAVASTGSFDLEMTPNGRYLYESNFGAPGAIQEFRVGTGGTLQAIGKAPTSGDFPLGMAVTPNGADLYVGLDSTPLAVERFAIGANGALTAKLPTTSLATNTYPQSLATSPNGHNLYVGDEDGGHGILQFSILSTGALKAMTPASVGTQQVSQLAFSPDGHNLYATAQLGAGNTVRYAVAANGALTATSNVAHTGQGSDGITVTPDQGPIAAFKITAIAAAGHASKFNASTSHDPDGHIVRYTWGFGDGHQTVSSGPTVSHTYQHKGTHTVTLTVTDNDGASTTVVFTGHQVLLDGSPAARVQHKITVPG